MMPAVSGNSSRPDFVGVASRTICRYSGRQISPPNMPMPMRKPTIAVRLNVALRNIRSGISASSPTRRSTTMNATSPTAPTA